MSNQTLKINQIKELQERGFDVNKFGSFRPNGEVILTYDGFNTTSASLFPTITIGDIIEILPKEIEENVLNIFAFGETWSVGWEGINYCGSNTLIDALFEILKWCIDEKHIKTY